ncbi:hypothetical protein [Nitratireductor sp. CH_MIT9313-5]|uniref:hypothetical protein n=1 Tax=Nitratireductor sp. CH_MIT9313-5 TaxID=3107764 RepID=UPI003009935D
MASLQYVEVVDAGRGWTRVRTADGRTVTVKGVRGTRNNNPGNIEYGKFARSQGAIGTDGRFAVFPTREQGTRAQANLIFESPSYRNLSLRQAISRYAPAFENNTKAYARAVAEGAGVTLDTPMRNIPASRRNAVVEAMHKVEGSTRPAKVYIGDKLVGVIDPSKETAPVQQEPVFADVPTPTPNPRATLASFAPAGTMAEPLNGILSSPVERAPLPAPSAMAYSEPWRGTPADPNALGQGTPGLLSYAPSPQRPDNLRYQGPQGLGGPGGIYVGGAPERGIQDKIAADLAQGDIGPVDPVEVMQPQQIAAPALPAPRTIQDYPVYSPEQPTVAPQQAPQVPSGMRAISGLFGAPQGAMAVSQSNPDVSFTSLGNGMVQKTNQYGHQQVLDAGDYSHPSSFGPTPDYGVQAPDVQVQPPERGFLSIPEPRTRLGQTVRGGLGGAAGAMAGGLLGPAGAILGGLIGRELAQGRNPLDAFSRQEPVSALNNSGFAVADPSLNQFPTAPAKPAGYREGSGPSYREMASYSPRAADHISRGGAGLF